MTPDDFLPLLESALQHRRIAFPRAAAIAFVESCWELIDDAPDVDAWAQRFIEAGAVDQSQHGTADRRRKVWPSGGQTDEMGIVGQPLSNRNGTFAGSINS